MGLLDVFNKKQSATTQEKKPNMVLSLLGQALAPGLVETYQNRKIASAPDFTQMQKMANQYGRADWTGEIARRQKLAEAQQQAELDKAREAIIAKVRFGGLPQTMPNQAPIQENTPIASIAQDMGAPLVDNAPYNPNTGSQKVIVNGSRQLPEGGQYTPFQDQAAPLLEQAKQLYAIGDTEGANAAFNDYQKISQNQTQQIAQTQASVIGAAINGYKVPDDPTTPVDESSFGIQSAIRELESMGMPLTQQQIDRLMDSTKRGYQAQVLQSLGNPELATKQNIETQGTYNQYRAPDIRDFGGSIGAVGTMPENAGQMVGLPIKKTIDPNNIYNQTQQNYRNTQDNKTRQSIEGARLSFNRDQAAFDRQYKLGLIDLKTRDLKIKESAAKNGIYINGGVANELVPADDLPEN